MPTDDGLQLAPPLSIQGVKIAKRPVVIADRRREAKTDVDRQVEDRHQGSATSSRPALI